jgi:hypothetical protein
MKDYNNRTEHNNRTEQQNEMGSEREISLCQKGGWITVFEKIQFKD